MAIDVSKFRKNGKQNWRELSPDGVFLTQQLKEEANIEESWLETMKSLEYYMSSTPQKFTDIDFLKKMSGYFGKDEALVASGLTRWFNNRQRLSDGMKEFQKMFSDDQLQRIDEVIDTERIVQIKSLDDETKLSRFGVDFFMLSKANKIVVNNLDKLVDILKGAVKEDLIAPEVIAAIQDLGFNIEDKPEETKWEKRFRKEEDVAPKGVRLNPNFGKEAKYKREKEESTSRFAKFRKEEAMDDYFVGGGNYGGGYRRSIFADDDYGFGSSFGSSFGKKYSSGGTSSFSSGGKKFGGRFTGGNRYDSDDFASAFSTAGNKKWQIPGASTGSAGANSIGMKPYKPISNRRTGRVFG